MYMAKFAPLARATRCVVTALDLHTTIMFGHMAPHGLPICLPDDSMDAGKARARAHHPGWGAHTRLSGVMRA